MAEVTGEPFGEKFPTTEGVGTDSGPSSDVGFPPGDEEGQTTAEYALLTGAMALILGLVAAWAASTGKIGGLLDAVFDQLIGSAGG